MNMMLMQMTICWCDNVYGGDLLCKDVQPPALDCCSRSRDIQIYLKKISRSARLAGWYQACRNTAQTPGNWSALDWNEFAIWNRILMRNIDYVVYVAKYYKTETESSWYRVILLDWSSY